MLLTNIKNNPSKRGSLDSLADWYSDLDNIIIDFVEGNAFPHKNEDDLWAGESSINLLNRLDGRTKGGYVENYEDLVSEMKAIDGEQKEINKMVDEVESAAVKAAHKVMEQYSEAFEKLAENKEWIKVLDFVTLLCYSIKSI